jgi:hypothetical protein
MVFYELVTGLTLYYGVNHYLSTANLNWTASETFRVLVFIHNMILSVFSGYIFVNGCMIMSNKTWYDVYGYSSEVLGKDPEFNRLTYLFYWSKYYEFVDTWINLLKNRDPGILQVYHHTGAVIVMGMGAYSNAQSIWLFVMFNSFVHTIMYMYYALSTLRWRIKGKALLTSLQITQLVTGLMIAWYYILCTEMSKYQLLGCLFNAAYLKGLIFLFGRFYYVSYVNNNKKLM